MKKSLLALFFLGMFFVGQSQNTPPVANNGSANGAEDGGPITGSVSATDTEGDALTYSVVSGVTAAQGTLSLNETTGAYSFTPAANFNGPVTFTFKVNDGTDDSGPATVTITVDAVNDAPILSDVIKANETEDATVTFAASDFSSKFSDVDGDNLTKVQITSLPSNGTLKLGPNNVTLDQEINLSDLGTLTFVPAANYNGSVSFDWNGYDGATYAASSASVNITLAAANDAPVANNGSVSGAEDGGAITGNVSATDADGNTLSYSIVSGVTAAQGTLSLNPTTGAYSFTPAANFNGSVTFTYRANDGTVNSNNATVTITVTAVNDAPVAVQDGPVTTIEDQPVSIDVLGNDSDPDGDTPLAIELGAATNGTVTVSNGRVVFTPTLDFFGTATFKYKAKDPSGALSNEITVTVNVTPVKDAGDTKILINEIYSDPNSGKSEFFELYNTSVDPTPVQLDCFTLVAYYRISATERGFYVIDLPQATIGAKQYFVGASKVPFRVQDLNGQAANFDWSNPGPTAFVKKYRFNNKLGNEAGYTDVTNSELTPDKLNNLFDEIQSAGDLAAFLFSKGVYVHGITIGFGTGTTVPPQITDLPPLTIPYASASCGTSFVADWKNTVKVAEESSGGGTGGTDNGFARLFDGNCGSWVKTSSSINHTPGRSNMQPGAVQRSILTTSQNIICGTRLEFTIASADPNVFPVDVRIYNDVNNSGIFDVGDVLFGAPITVTSSSSTVYAFTGLDPNAKYLIVYNTNLGCSDAIVVASTTPGITTAQYSYCNQQFGAAITTANEVALANAFPVTVNFYNTVGGVKTLIGTGSISAPSTIQVYSNFSATPYTPANISIEYVPKSSSCLATTTVANVAATQFVNVTGTLQTNEQFVLLTPNTAGSPGKMEVRVTGINTSGPGFVAANVVPVTANLFYDKDPAKTTDDVFIESMTINDFSTQFQQFQKVFTKADLDANGQFLVVTYTANMQCLTNRSPQQSMQVLPVKFSAFTASRNAANKKLVDLSWETAMEQNNKGFYLQRMTRGEWQDIGFVNTAAVDGNSNMPLKYNFSDVNLFGGTTYYRMYQVDFDGKADYSEVKSVDGPGSGKMSVVIYPNPAYGGSTTVVFASETPKQILLNDAKGRIIQQWRNYTGTRLSINQLKPGFYTLRIQDGAHGSPVIEKIIVQ